jgi:hypothetical protein
MKTTVRTETEAARASAPRKLLKPGWHSGRITEAIEKVAQSGNDCIELTVMFGDRTLRDWLVDADRAAAKLRHCCQACGDEVFERYTAGEITQDDLPGHDVEVKIVVRRGYNQIEDYRAPAASRVVSLRAG